MQQLPQTLPGSGKVALKYGLIFGGAICLIDILYSIVLDTTHPGFLDSLAQALSSLHDMLFITLYVLIVSLPLYLLLMVAFLAAGLFSARQTHKASTGMLAGLWAATLFGVIDLLIANLGLDLLIMFPQIQRENSAAVAVSIEQGVISSTFSYGIVAGLILIGLGLGIGALGGAMGKGKAQPQPAYPPPLLKPYPAPANQPYPTPPYASPQPFLPGQPPPPGQFPPGNG